MPLKVLAPRLQIGKVGLKRAVIGEAMLHDDSSGMGGDPNPDWPVAGAQGASTRQKNKQESGAAHDFPPTPHDANNLNSLPLSTSKAGRRLLASRPGGPTAARPQKVDSAWAPMELRFR